MVPRYLGGEEGGTKTIPNPFSSTLVVLNTKGLALDDSDENSFVSSETGTWLPMLLFTFHDKDKMRHYHCCQWNKKVVKCERSVNARSDRDILRDILATTDWRFCSEINKYQCYKASETFSTRVSSSSNHQPGASQQAAPTNSAHNRLSLTWQKPPPLTFKRPWLTCSFWSVAGFTRYVQHHLASS